MEKQVHTKKTRLNPRKTFWQKGACSHAMFHLLNHEFGNTKTDLEKASDLLAGGIAQKGYQCGMIWGAALAAGNEANNRYEDINEAVFTAIQASKLLIESFEKRAKAVNCIDVAKVDWEKRFEMIIYMIKTIFQGFVYNPCFNLIVKWTQEAIEAAKSGLESESYNGKKCLSCASEVVKQMGGSQEEAAVVAGFAGGVGLSGNACGALAAAIWYKMLLFIKSNKGKTPTMFKNPESTKIIEIFQSETKSQTFCKDICGKVFKDVYDHTEYLENGGCENLIKVLANAK